MLKKTEIQELFCGELGDQMKYRYCDSTADHRAFVRVFNDLSENQWFQRTHLSSHAQMVGQLYSWSVESSFDGLPYPRVTARIVANAVDHIDGVLFPIFLETVGIDVAVKVYESELGNCHFISNGDKVIARRCPCLKAITHTVDRCFHLSRQESHFNSVFLADQQERVIYLDLVVMHDHPRHPVKIKERQRILRTSQAQAKKGKVYSHEQAALLLEMDVDIFRSLWTSEATPSVLNQLYKKTGYLDRRLRPHNFLPEDALDSADAAGSGIQIDPSINPYELEAEFLRAEDNKVIDLNLARDRLRNTPNSDGS